MRVAELQLWEEPKELWLRSMLVVMILLLNVADVITTQMSLARGGVELNPVSGWLIQNGMLPHVKVAVAAFIVVGAIAATNRRRVSTLLAPVVALYVIVVATNGIQLALH